MMIHKKTFCMINNSDIAWQLHPEKYKKSVWHQRDKNK